jgi:hypothetical protein
MNSRTDVPNTFVVNVSFLNVDVLKTRNEAFISPKNLPFRVQILL